MWRTVLIVLHSAAGLIAFAAGCVAMWRRTLFELYFWSLIAMLACLVAALAVDWPELNMLSRALFSALTALGVYMVWRAFQARALLPTREAAERASYIHHVGFTLIALFVGFAAIAVLDVSGPGWLAAVVGAASVLAGRAAVDYVERHVP